MTAQNGPEHPNTQSPADRIRTSGGPKWKRHVATIIFRILKKNPGVLAAYDILDLVQEGYPKLDEYEVSQGLDLLLELGLIERSEGFPRFRLV